MRKNQNSPLRFQPVNQAERQRFAQQAQDVHRFGQQRQKLETNVAGGPAGARTFAPASVRLPGSPIAAKSAAVLSKSQAAPKTFVAPKPDPKVTAKPRAKPSPSQPQQRTVNRVPLDQPRTQQQPPAKVEQVAKQPQSQPQAKQPQPQPQGNPPAGRTSGGPRQNESKDKEKK
jgi:hypothetical protein